MLASTPSEAHSCSDGPLIWAAAGALPETTRDFSTVMAESPPPPATAKSFQLWPLDCSVAFSAEAALASPPEVHQCSTSTSPACARPATVRPAATASILRAKRVVFSIFFMSAPVQGVGGCLAQGTHRSPLTGMKINDALKD